MNLSFRYSVLLYSILFALLTFPYWLLGEVVAPHRQSIEIGAAESMDARHLENRKFTDYNYSFIPELTIHRQGRHSQWLGVWNESNELGRPLYHLSGFSYAYPPAIIIGALSDSAERFITILSLLTCFLAGIFMLLLFRELNISNVAGLLAAGSVASSPLFMYWLTFPMFPAIWCWSAGAFYAMTRLAKGPDLVTWGILVFCIYSLMMLAYPQAVVHQAYILAGYGLYRAAKLWRLESHLAAATFLGTCFISVIVAVFLILPVYIDLAHTTLESSRTAPELSFFLAVLPKADSILAVWRLLVLSTFPEIFGNPISPSYPFVYNGLSLTPLVVFLLVIAAAFRFRATWGWWLAATLFVILTFILPVFSFAVEYLGFNLSRTIPLGAILIPLSVLAGFGADALLQQEKGRQRRWVTIGAILITFCVLLTAIVFSYQYDYSLAWQPVGMTILVLALLLVQAEKPRPALLIAALIVTGAYVSFPLMLRQDYALIAKNSSLVEAVRESLPRDSRFAVAAPGVPALSPNLNATLGLSSVHSYNSLSSRRYHSLIERLGGEMRAYGRWNNSISSDYDSYMFWMSNIGLVLSSNQITHTNLDYLGQTSGIHFYHVVSRMGCCIQVSLPNSISDSGASIADPRDTLVDRPAILHKQSDSLELELQPGDPSLLIIDHQFHRDWRARVLLPSGWDRAKTVPVNGVFQGVILPKDAQRVSLEFKPFVRFAWVSHVFWLLLLIIIAIRKWVFCPSEYGNHPERGLQKNEK